MTTNQSDNNILEGNKLIAEFMGETIRKDGKIGLKDKEPLTGHCIVDAKYHYSFDWLMPVVEKIEKIKDNHHGYFGVHISSNNCTIQATNFNSGNPIGNPPYYFADHYGDTKIQATYKAVVEFITWYNTLQS